MESFETLTEFQAAVATVKEAAAAYYDGEAILMTDADWDHLVDQIAASVTQHPDWDAQGILTQVAAGASAGGDIVHDVDMLSLQKATTPTEITAFLNRIGNIDCVTEVKLDGMAVTANYINGHLTQVATRGDGHTGENITPQAQTINGLPVNTGDNTFTATVRGEVYMTDIDLEVSNVNRVAQGGTPYANPRNAVAGSLRKTDTTSQMSFAAYDTHGPSTNHQPTHTDRMTTLENQGITTARTLITPTSNNPQTAITEIETARPTLNYPIDGAVIKANQITHREQLGTQTRHPRWAIAYKYAAAEAQSTLRDIEIAVGRTGRISLTGIIDPVHVAGATVTRATLHNPTWLHDQKLGIGSTVIVIRANDVIPRITAAIGQQNPNITPYVTPSQCPQCENDWDTSSLLWRCHSPECSAVGALTYYCSRDAMDIEGAGETICEALVNSGLANNAANLYDLTIDQLTNLELGDGRLLGEKNAVKIHAQIQKSKEQPFNRVITGLGIRLTGRSVSRWLASEFHTMTALRAATVEEVAAIEKMGLVKAQSVVDGLKARGDMIDRLAVAGVNMGAEPDQAAGDLPLAGMTIVISGSIPGFTRTEAQEAVERLGGKASGSVSKSTSALVTSETTTSKAVKAAELGVKIINPVEFAKTLAG